MLSSRIIPFVRYSFLTIRSMSEVDFCFFSPESIIPEKFFVLSFQLPLSNYPGVSFKCSLISSWSLCSHVSKSPQVSSFVFLILPGVSLSLLRSFSNSLRWFVPLLLSFSILSVVHSRFHFLRYHINSFVLSESYRWLLKTFSSLRYISLNPFNENK